MLDLFRQETEAQTAILTEGLLALERDPAQGERLAALMRAAHSLKGAARIVGLAPSVAVAHAMEDCLVAAQQGALQIGPDLADALLRGVDMLAGIARAGDADAWRAGHQAELDALLADLAARRVGGPAPAAPAPAPDPGPQPARGPDPAPAAESGQRAVRVGAEHLDRMLSMMGEVMVQTRWLEPFGEALQAMRRQLRDLARLAGPSGADWRPALAACRETMARQAESLDFFSRRHAELAERLYRFLTACTGSPAW